MNNFTKLKLGKDNLDNYYIRNAIFTSLNNNLPLFKGSLLDFGCGKMPYKEHILQNSNVDKYVGLDIEGAINYDSKIEPDITWNGITMPFENDSFDTAFGTEVLEHCSNPETLLKEVLRVLKPKGYIFGTVPFLWPIHEAPYDEYRYTPFALKRHFINSGFVNIEIKATGGWHASMAQMLGLWVKRSPMSSKKRKILSIILKPIIKFLINYDSNTSIDFLKGPMITGLSFTAQKIR